VTLTEDGRSDGHLHFNTFVPRPSGKFESGTGPTEPGSFLYKYTADKSSGLIQARINCTIPDSRQCDPARLDIKVKVDGLVDLVAYGPSLFVPVGDKPWHPSNHFGTPGLVQSLLGLASAYWSKFNDVLY